LLHHKGSARLVPSDRSDSVHKQEETNRAASRVISSRGRIITRIVLLVASFIGLFPISIRLADPLFTHPFRTGWQYEYPVLLVWPDRVEMRWFHNISEVSPRPKDESYTYNVAPEQQAWVEKTVRSTPVPHGVDAGWIIHVKQIGPSGQKIQFELLGDGITGMVYEAGPDEIVPLRSRLAGPEGSMIILVVHLLLWGGLWLLLWFISRLVARRRRQPSAVL
jgi:hypothetical protein